MTCPSLYDCPDFTMKALSKSPHARLTESPPIRLSHIHKLCHMDLFCDWLGFQGRDGGTFSSPVVLDSFSPAGQHHKRSLTHWGRVTHICVDNLAIIGPDNGLSPGRRQAIIWINAGILLIGPCGTNFSEILIGIQIFSFKKMHWKCRLRNFGHFVSASMC